jgi:hypothetical protein
MGVTHTKARVQKASQQGSMGLEARTKVPESSTTRTEAKENEE